MHEKIEHLLRTSLHKLAADGRPIPHKPWQKALSNVATRISPAFHESPWMEWQYGIWVGAFAAYDEIGRQLGEANVLPEWRATPLDDKWRPFKGPGSRNGHPFNMDAMHEMVACWDDLLVDAAKLREIYCQRYQRSGRLGAWDLYIITGTAVAISSFLMRRGDAPIADGKLPRNAAAAFKVIGGMFAASVRMTSQAHPMLSQSTLDTDDFLHYLEEQHLLLSPEMRACAGPERMIKQIFAAVIEPPEQPPENALDYLGDDLERAFDYGEQCARIDFGVLLHWRSLARQLKPLLNNPAMPAEIRAMLLDEMELGIENDTPLADYQAITTRLIGDVFAHQPDIPEPLDVKQIGANCRQLEQTMRRFYTQEHARLDQILQRQSTAWEDSDWTPAPGSQFVKALVRAYPALS